MRNKLQKHSTLCWECEWAGGKDKKCPWANNFEPVPGWKAKPTKILRQSQTSRIKREYVDSFDVYECPMFELITEIKQNLFEKAGRRRKRRKEEKLKAVKKLRFEDGKTIEEIAYSIDIDERTVCRLLKEIKERKKNGKEV